MTQQNPPLPNRLQVTFELDGDVALMGIEGDVDASSVEDLIRIVRGARSLGARSFILNCAGTTYLDSSGIRFLVDLHRTLSAEGGTISIRDASAPVRRVLHITGLDTLVHVG